MARARYMLGVLKVPSKKDGTITSHRSKWKTIEILPDLTAMCGNQNKKKILNIKWVILRRAKPCSNSNDVCKQFQEEKLAILKYSDKEK